MNVKKRFTKYWRTLGPGLVTGAADDDPSGIATYSQTGAQFGFQFLWLALFSFPLMGVVQEMCARLGMVTGKGLAQNIRENYPRPVLYICVSLLVLANTFNIGADLAAMGATTRLVFPAISPLAAIIFFVATMFLLEVFATYRVYAKYLKFSAITLFAYIIVGFLVDADWTSVFSHTLIPSMSFTKESFLIVCAILGTTISPYLFFWQTSQEVEEEILSGKKIGAAMPECTDEDIRTMHFDIWSGMFVSNIVMFFIILACGATLYKAGITNIATAADAARALEPIAGASAYLLFAAGIIGTGLLAIPVLAGSSAYAVSEAFGWKEGLYNKFRDAKAFYAVVGLSMFFGAAINLLGIDPIKALIYSAVANGIVAPIILFFILGLTGKGAVMGSRVNGTWARIFGWTITVLMAAAGCLAIYSIFAW